MKHIFIGLGYDMLINRPTNSNNTTLRHQIILKFINSSTSTHCLKDLFSFLSIIFFDLFNFELLSPVDLGALCFFFINYIFFITDNIYMPH